jgi:hypothetical protein
MNFILPKFSHIRIERLLFWCESMLLLLAVVAYIYFTAASVTHVVYRQELGLAIQDVESHISELETRYLAGSTMLSRSVAEDMGLVTLGTVAYVSVEEDGGRLTRRE